jgi:AI-2 transport protein TqsA
VHYPSAVPLLASIAATILVLIGLHLAASVVVPVILALGMAIAFQPVSAWVQRRGLPPVITALITIATVSLTVLGAGIVMVGAFGDLTTALPRYQATAIVWRDAAASWLADHHLTTFAATVGEIQPGKYVNGLVSDAATTVGGVLQTVALVVLLTVFIQLEAASFPARLRAILGSARRSRESIEHTIEALGEVQRYMLAKIIASTVRAVLVGVITFGFGLEQPLLWAALAFALNFVPVLGPIAASAPPIATAALTLGWWPALILALMLLAIWVVLGAVIEPRVMGRVVGLSPLVVVLSITLWAFVLGPIGALMAVPLTMVTKLALAESEHHAWLARLLEYRPLPAIALVHAAPKRASVE